MHGDKKGYNWLLLAAIALTGLVIFVLAAPRIFSPLPRHISLNRSEAITKGGQHLQLFGFQPGEYRAHATLEVRRDLIQYIENQFKPAERDSVLHQLPAYAWQVRWSRPENDELPAGVSRNTFPAAFAEVFLQIDLYGVPVSFWSEVKKESIGVNLSAFQARAIADSTLARTLGPEADHYTFSKTSSSILDSHTEHLFTYNRNELICGLQQQLNVVVSGALVSKFARQYNPPAYSSWQKERIIQTLPFGLLIISLSIIFIVDLIRRLRTDSINFRYALVPALAGSVLTILMIVLEPGLSGLDSLLLGSLFSGFFVGVTLFLAVAVGESNTRTLTGDKLLYFDAMLRGQLRYRAMAGALLHGLGFGAALAGLVALVMTIASLFGTISIASLCAELHRDASSVPFLVSFIRVINEVLWYQFALVLAFLPLLMKSMHRTKWAVFLFALITAVGLHMDMKLPSEPLGVNLIVGLLIMTSFAMIFIRYDLVTVVTTHFTYALIFATAPLLLLGHPTFWYSGLFLLLPLAGIAAFAVWAWPVHMSREQLRNFLPRQAVKIVENERLKRELEIASRVQMSFLPKQTPRMEGLEISSICLPASEVGGDYYDFIEMGDGRLGFAIGDVSGKGVSAAFYMTLTKGFLRSLSRTTWSPAQVMIEMNKLFYQNVERGHFISLIFGILDLPGRKMTFARAGHDPIFWYRAEQEHLERLLPPGIALGLEPGDIFSEIIREQIIDVEPGDLFVLYTDGFSEAMNEYANEFSEERLAQSIKRLADLPTDQILAKIKTQVAHFVGHTPQHDDMTMIIMRVLKP